ncbi:MAG TPA: FHA domain-containing protein [Polyangiales bacterium]|nr:FHA domain-containing protein [Polyangiales bacterium]
MITLVISDNEGTTTRVPLVLDEVSIGRKEGNTIRLTERNISRDHCRIARVEAEYVVRDLNSYNGVLVNGQRIERELRIKPGDEIKIGDYTVALEAEIKTEMAPPPPPPPRTSQSPGSLPPARPLSPVPRAPARLVVLTQPLAGAEFALPEQGQVRVGRASDLEVSIDHRSVSREHAVLSLEGGRARIADQGSANGLVVNRDKVSDATLAAGDLVELGDVVLRFCAVGEKYVFDPIEARALVASRRPRARWHVWAAAAIIGAALIGALVIVRSPGDGPEAQLDPEPAATVLPAPVAAATAPSVMPSAPAAAEVDKVPELVQACRAAVDGGRFAEGMAHAGSALKLRPDAADAIACQSLARSRHEQEQIYVRASAALESGDVEGAWSELLALDDSGPVAQRPEVAKSVEAVAGRVLDRAAQLARRDIVQAAALARSVVERPALSSGLRQRAQSLLTKVDRSSTPPDRAVASAKPVRAAEPAHEPKEQKPAPARARPAAANSAPPMETATACLGRGDNQCVIRALAGRAQTAQELGLLIETYRAVGESALAYRSMATYVQRFPTARKADQYRALLGRQGQ